MAVSKTYRFVAKDWQGYTRDGYHSAGNLREALDNLHSQNLVVLQIREQTGGTEKGIASRVNLFKKKAKARDFMLFCRQFGTMLSAGMTALHALQVLVQQMEHLEFQEKIRRVAHDLEKGSTMEDAFGAHLDFFPKILVNMIAAGETGGILDEVLERLADHFQKQHDLEEKLRSATTYPVVITVVMFLVMSVMVFFVLPRFADIFDSIGIQLPLITRLLLGTVNFVLHYWYLVLGAMILLVAGLVYAINTPGGRLRFDRLKLKAPIFGPIYTKTVIARFARTLSTLMVSGVGLLPSLELVEKVIDNVVLGRSLEDVGEAVRTGQSISVPLRASAIFPPLVVEMVHVGEETGGLDEMLRRTADFYEAEVAYVVDRLGTIIEPVLILVIGFFVGLLIISIITPLFQIYQSI